MGAATMARLDVAGAQWRTLADELTGREVRQYTSTAAHSYPLYYFVPSITADGHYLVFHSESSGSVQLHRLDLADGTSVQLTEGTTHDAGWAIWCEYHVDGIYNHLAALNVVTGDVYYFDHEQLRSVSVTTGEEQLIAELIGRIPVGQSAFSPDGRLFVFVDADRETFTHAYAEREKLELANAFSWSEHHSWRARVPTRIGLVDTQTGEVRTLIELTYHVHHVLFTDNETVLVNHVPDGSGMWSIRIDGSAERTLRPADDHGSVCHQVVVDGGVLYETSGGSGQRRGETWFGRYRFAEDTWEEWCLPADIGYVHTGNDPAGRFLFIEGCARGRHALYQVHPRPGQEFADVSPLRGLNPDVYDRLDRQRHHAHPFLSPDRRQLFFTDVIDGYSQVCSIEVGDLS
jgi:WD40-like Beta Propeller Repeat